MIPAVKKYSTQMILAFAMGLFLVWMATSLVPVEDQATSLELISVPAQEVEQTRSVSPESLIISAAKAIVHALLPVS